MSLCISSSEGHNSTMIWVFRTSVLRTPREGRSSFSPCHPREGVGRGGGWHFRLSTKCYTGRFCQPQEGDLFGPQAGRTALSTFSQPEMHLLAFWALKWQISLLFHILELVKSPPFEIPKAWERYPLRAEPPRLGHYREYLLPPPPPHPPSGSEN